MTIGGHCQKDRLLRLRPTTPLSKDRCRNGSAAQPIIFRRWKMPCHTFCTDITEAGISFSKVFIASETSHPASGQPIYSPIPPGTLASDKSQCPRQAELFPLHWRKDGGYLRIAPVSQDTPVIRSMLLSELHSAPPSAPARDSSTWYEGMGQAKQGSIGKTYTAAIGTVVCTQHGGRAHTYNVENLAEQRDETCAAKSHRHKALYLLHVIDHSLSQMPDGIQRQKRSDTSVVGSRANPETYPGTQLGQHLNTRGRCPPAPWHPCRSPVCDRGRGATQL